MSGINQDSRRQNVARSGELVEALGQSEVFLEFQERLSRVAPINRPVLLLGERGTGKELAAARLHYLSDRWQGPLVALNCSALNPSLIESELFGYEKGAFTGAAHQHQGRFETATGGTLFLDEIGNIPLEVQEKILRVVEYATYERVGSSVSIEADVRIVAATNVDLIMMASNETFKQDLLDRLSFEVLFLPPLRERKEDIVLLANHFAHRMAYELGLDEMPYFSPAAESALRDYDWPGNIRELKNVIERAVYRSDADVIEMIDFDPFRSPYKPPSGVLNRGKIHVGRQTAVPQLPEEAPPPETGENSEPGRSEIDTFMTKPLREAVELLEVTRLKYALTESKYNQKAAAHSLGLTYHQFRGLYRKYEDQIT